jgi:acetylglutamate kinase
MGDTLPNALNRAEILVQALPHMQRYDKELVVIKYGGHAMGDACRAEDFAEDIDLSSNRREPIVVACGGPQIGRMLDKLGIKSEFRGRAALSTDEATVEVVEMVLAGSINKQIVGGISGPRAAVPSPVGKDGKHGFLPARRPTGSEGHPRSTSGFVGEPRAVTARCSSVVNAELIPVIAPWRGPGQKPTTSMRYFAGAIAGAIGAKRLLLLTDVPGVLDKNKKLLPELTVEDCRRLIADGTITDGMIPKIETCIYAIERGVEAVVILDGKVPHAVLLELFTDYGAGTLIRRT